MTKNICPHCEGTNPIPRTAFVNAENYGSNAFHVLCIHCLKPIMVILTRIIQIDFIDKSHKKPEDCEVW